MKKDRKVTRGPIRDKEKTMKKLVRAVGSILEKKGYAGLNGNSIAKEAKVDRRLIYSHFGSVDKLVEVYIQHKDFWTPETNTQLQDILSNPKPRGQEDILLLLNNQFNAILSNKELQRILLWELSESNPILRKISDGRELLGESLFQFVEPDFKDSNLDLRAILALMISGVYYSALHAVNNGSTFCGIDINQPEGKLRIEGAIQQLLNMCYGKLN